MRCTQQTQSCKKVVLVFAGLVILYVLHIKLFGAFVLSGNEDTKVPYERFETQISDNTKTQHFSFPTPGLKKYTCASGTPPWSHLDPYEELSAFRNVFASRPGDGKNKGLGTT